MGFSVCDSSEAPEVGRRIAQIQEETAELFFA
jgi:hypothetical protein